MYNPLTYVDRALNSITMYKLVAWGLLALMVVALAFSATGQLSLPLSGLAVSFLTLGAICYATNWLFGRFWPAIRNTESFMITALILGFILPPPNSISTWFFIIMGGIIAMASKYMVAIHHKHLFNPAAFAALALGLANLWPASWWVGSPVLLPFTAVLGFLIIRKLRRFNLFASFLLLSLMTTVTVTALHHAAIPDALKTAFTSSPLIFLGTVMLTEPFTMPPRLKQQLIYGALVGVVFSAQLQAGRFSTTPEAALILGNIFSYLVSPKRQLLLKFKSKKQLADNIYDLTFGRDEPFAFKAGQYLEWTLPGVETDIRGNRRTFSIASGPEDDDIHIGTKTSQQLRGFKKALLDMKPGDTISAGQLAGNFVLPKDKALKLVFVAGGIGVTPFISMLEHLRAMDQRRDIALFYMISRPDELVYRDTLAAATKRGITIIPVLSGKTDKPADWKYPTGYLTKQLLEKHVPDYTQRAFYLSGPDALVKNYRRLLRSLGVGRRAIVSDYFSGY